MGISALMTELKSGFQAIDSKLDTLNNRLETMNSRMESHETRITNTEQRISDLEDKQPTIQKRLERTEVLLKQVATKAEDLKARSRRCNRLAGIAEFTNTGPMARFVEKVLIELFGRDTYSANFAIE